MKSVGYRLKETKQSNDWLTKVKDTSSLMAAGAGIAYITGFFVANIRMYDYGFLGLLPLVRIRYLVIGITALTYCAIGLVPIWTYGILRLSLPAMPPKNQIGLLHLATYSTVISIVITYFLSKLYFFRYGTYDGGIGNFADPLYISNILAVLAIVLWCVFKRHERYFSRRVAACTSAFALIITLFAYSYEIYPHIAISAGGGRPVAVRMLLNQRASDGISGGGFTVRSNGWTSDIDLIDATDDYYIVQGASYRLDGIKPDIIFKDKEIDFATCIDKDLVEAISLQPSRIKLIVLEKKGKGTPTR